MPKDKAIQLIDDANTGSIGDVKVNVVRDALGRITQGIVVGNTLYQNEALILLAHEGDVKEYPMLGVGFTDALLDDDLLQWRHKIREHMAMDGLNVSQLDFYAANKLRLEASYGNG